MPEPVSPPPDRRRGRWADSRDGVNTVWVPDRFSVASSSTASLRASASMRSWQSSRIREHASAMSAPSTPTATPQGHTHAHAPPPSPPPLPVPVLAPPNLPVPSTHSPSLHSVDLPSRPLSAVSSTLSITSSSRALASVGVLVYDDEESDESDDEPPPPVPRLRPSTARSHGMEDEQTQHGEHRSSSPLLIPSSPSSISTIHLDTVPLHPALPRPPPPSARHLAVVIDFRNPSFSGASDQDDASLFSDSAVSDEQRSHTSPSSSSSSASVRRRLMTGGGATKVRGDVQDLQSHLYDILEDGLRPSSLFLRTVASFGERSLETETSGGAQSPRRRLRTRGRRQRREMTATTAGAAIHAPSALNCASIAPAATPISIPPTPESACDEDDGIFRDDPALERMIRRGIYFCDTTTAELEAEDDDYDDILADYVDDDYSSTHHLPDSSSSSSSAFRRRNNSTRPGTALSSVSSTETVGTTSRLDRIIHEYSSVGPTPVRGAGRGDASVAGRSRTGLSRFARQVRDSARFAVKNIRKP
ncbi:uncharacterized protein V1518DRAFT_406868 [Limtongia smithiae]|uniref:uncharacterized protein n=1 Tax=Limtongia smithiae TaxID=1125753 RepID=UPI0034CE6C55